MLPASMRGPLLPACLALAILVGVPCVGMAQAVQVAPFGGYRFGGDLYEWFAGTRLDAEAAPCAGVVVDVFVRDGTALSFSYSRQWTDVTLADPLGGGIRKDRLFVEHWHIGGTQELDGGRIRPFLGGSLGLTRFGGARDSAVRFSLAGSAGVKMMASEHVGARLEGRVYGVWVDGGIHRTICGGFGCAIDLDVLWLWQAELTAGLVLSF
jgi:hypothetical protein